jgi:hypothetical protein
MMVDDGLNKFIADALALEVEEAREADRNQPKHPLEIGPYSTVYSSSSNSPKIN